MQNGFTLLELIVVIIILGILAALGYTQYTTIVEKGRLAEATVNIGYMRKLATEYYLKNGSLTGMQNSDVGADNACVSTNFFRYGIYLSSSTVVSLEAGRCTSGGKTPNASRLYWFYLYYVPASGVSDWHCYYSDDSSSCFGLPP